MATDTWEQLFYFIACPRKDGTAPGLEKAWEEKFYLTYYDAEEALNETHIDLRGYGKIFTATASIPRNKPVTEEVG